MTNRLNAQCTLTIIVGVALMHCSDDGASEPAVQEAVETAATTRIVPRMSALASAAEALEADVSAFCTAPTESALGALQEDWLELSKRWNEAAAYIFGPLDDNPITPSFIFIESMRQRGIDYTETVRIARDTAIDGDATLDEAFFDRLTFTQVGLLSLEVSLFETRTGTPSVDIADVASELANEPRQCAYLGGLAGLLARRTRQVEAQWTQGSPSFLDRLLTGDLEDGSDPAVTVLLGVTDQVEYLRRRKLGGILDARLAGAARPEVDPFVENLLAFLSEVEAVMTGTEDQPSFFAVMEVRGHGADVATVQASLQAARQALVPLDRDAAGTAFDDLELRFRREVPLALDVDLGINFSDGD